MLVVSLLAATAAPCAAATAPIVRVYVAGSEEAVSGSREAIEDQCARSYVAVVVRDAAGADEALLAQSPATGLAEAYIDLRAGSAPRVVLVDSETRKTLERRSLPEGASLEISIETAAHVVCAAVESLLATRAPAPAPAAPPTPPVVPEIPPESGAAAPLPLGPRWTSQLELFAAGASFGAGFQAGGGASFGLSHGRGPLRFGASLAVLGYPATDVESAGGVAKFGLLGARLLPTIEWHATQLLTAFAGLGVGADWIRVAAEQPPPGAVPQAASTNVDAIASGMMGVRLQLAGRVAALLALDADIALTRHRYVIETPQGSQTFFEPARVRPVALAGLCVSLTAPARPSARTQARK